VIQWCISESFNENNKSECLRQGQSVVMDSMATTSHSRFDDGGSDQDFLDGPKECLDGWVGER